MAKTNTVKTWSDVVKQNRRGREARVKAMLAATEAGVVKFNRQRDTLLSILRDQYCRGLKFGRIGAAGAKPAFDADSPWRGLSLLADKYFSQEWLMREFMKLAWKATNRKKRLRDIAEVLERAQDMISETHKGDLSHELFFRWCREKIGSRPLDDSTMLTTSDLEDELGQVFAGLGILATAARRAASEVSPARPGKPAILPRDCIRSLGDIYRESTGQEPRSGHGGFYRFVVQFRAALDPTYRVTDESGTHVDESLVDAVKLALGKRSERPKRRKQPEGRL